jgi:outer membrane protein assembly factor BamB/tetratricopeptide (TPR) repeat protein
MPGDAPPALTVTLPGETRVRQKLEAAHDYIKAGTWDDAVRVLQDLVELKEDQFLARDRALTLAKPASEAGSVRGEALRLLAGLPPRGRDAYNSAFGPKARALLKEATERDDVQLLTQVVERYAATEAGAEATERLGTYHLDRGQRDLAGRCFSLLLSRTDPERLPPLTLYKAAAACRLAGDSTHEERAWKVLVRRAPEGLTIDGRQVNLDRLRDGLARLADSSGRADWRVFRGDASRGGRGDGDVPLLEPVWTAETVFTKQGTAWVDQAVKSQALAGRLLLPGFYPIAVPGRIIHRTHSGLRALDPTTGAEVWHYPAVGSPLSLDGISRHSGQAVTVRSWIQGSYGDASHFPLENSALGCLSTDGARVYAVEDLAVPPPGEVMMQLQGGVVPPGSREWIDSLQANRVRALDLDTGALRWEIGGRGDLAKSFFLGAPLPIAGKLYALVERESEVRLLCLDPPSGAVLWSQRLGVTPTRLALDPGRRLRGVQMTYAGGLLLCPTDAGALFAIDPLTRSLAWVHVYPSKKQPPETTGVFFDPAAFHAAWRESAPAVAGDRVIFTPGDSEQVHCVGLRDGKPLWQAERKGSTYFAGAFRHKALLVGAAGARALSVKDGSEAWARNVGVPSGQGAAGGDVYYLPLRAASETGGPGVVAINVADGKVLALAQSRRGDVPGNLIFFRGQVVSQTATTLAVYPQLKARLQRVEELLAKDPRDPRGLMERGTLRLDQGDVPRALADLRDALAASPAGEVKQEAHGRLHEALKQAVQRDFAAGEKYLAEFEASYRVPVPDGATADQRGLLELEQKRREANYLLVLARGREGQGQAADALSAYARLFARADHVIGIWNGPEVGWMAIGKPTAPLDARLSTLTRPSLWVQGRVAALVTGAAGAQKEAVEKEVARQWREMPAGAGVDELGRFVALFGTVGSAGMEARLAYAERLGADWARGRFLEAELHLLALQRQREAPQVAARALELLARLLTDKGQPDDALYYYRQLADEFGTTAVRDGKTGADFLKGLALDRRFLPLLDDPWAGAKFKTSEVHGLFLPPGNMMAMEPEGEAPPCLRRLRLAFDLAGSKLKLYDRNTGAELWSHSVSVGNLRLILRTAAPQAWVPYRADGHVAVVSLGQMVYGIDLLERRLLWSKNLGDAATPPVQGIQNMDERGRLTVAYQDQVVQQLGLMAPIRAAAVGVVARGQLTGLDPLHGDLLWQVRLDGPRADLYSDDSYVYLQEAPAGQGFAVRRAVGLREGAARSLPNPAPMIAAPVGRLLPRATAGTGGRGDKLALHDPLTGKEVWTHPLAKDTSVASSEVPHLTATIERNGKVHVFDLRRRQEVFQGQVDPDHLRGVHEVRLFQDRSHLYLMLNREVRGRDGLAGPATPNALGGMRCLPAHGRLYAFRRGGSLHWQNEVKGQYLILDRMDELPLLLFSAVVQRTGAQARGPEIAVASIDKATGKTMWPEAKDYAPANSPVYRIQFNPAAGTIDLVAVHWKMRHTVTE